MKRLCLKFAAAALMLTAAHAATAQPPQDMHVTLSHKDWEKAVRDFVYTYPAPAPKWGMYARWPHGVCPETGGLRVSTNAYITRRVKEVATMIGGDAKAPEGCETNTRIFFADNAQGQINEIAAKTPEYLGYYFQSQLADLTTMRFPVQSWYATQSEDANGVVTAENFDIATPTPGYGAPLGTFRASRMNRSWRSEFLQATIIVDLPKVKGVPIDAMADYVTMLALSQSKVSSTCQHLPSITNLFAENCAKWKTDGMTETDLAYLRALYHADPTFVAEAERGDLITWMMRSYAERH